MKLFQIARRRPPAPGPGPLRIFVTGATGTIGSAVVRELVAAGHEVTGMTRWAERTLEIRDLGAGAVVGELRDSGTFRRIAARHDVLIHLAAETGRFREAADRAAIDALLWAARQGEPDDRPPRHVIHTSTTFVLGETGADPADEDRGTAPGLPPSLAWRADHERLLLDGGTEDVITAIVRPGMVLDGREGAVERLVRSIPGESAVPGGGNRWPTVYLRDLAVLYRLIAEARAGGIFHGIGEPGTPLDVLVEQERWRNRKSGPAAVHAGAISLPLDLADALTIDQVVVAKRGAALGWLPTERRPLDPARVRPAGSA